MHQTGARVAQKKLTMKHAGLLIAASAAWLMFAGTAAAQPYTVVELSLPPGQERVTATDINNRLQIVGSAGGEVLVWDTPSTPPRTVGVDGVSLGAAPKINDAGVIAGLRMFSMQQFRPFILAGGVLYHPPIPQNEPLPDLTTLLDNGFAIITGESRSWAALNDTIYDLTAITGARIQAGNDAILIGGEMNGLAYLRFPDGRVVVPWSELGSSVKWIGPAGHIAGPTPGSGNLYYGRPDGSVTTIGNFPGFFVNIGDINRRGDWVGTTLFSIRFVNLTQAWIYRNSRLLSLNTAVLDYPLQIHAAYAITDAGYIVASALVRMVGLFAETRPVLLVPAAPRAPSDLVFSISGRTVTLTWQEPVGALDYVIEVGSFPGGSNLISAPIGPNTSLTATAPPGRYYVRVRARNDVGLGAASAEAIIDVP